jgi:signal transduction histidine kinase
MSEFAVPPELVPAPALADSRAPELLVQQSEFFAALSHELRTPLAAVKGFAQMLVVHWDALPEAKRFQQAEHILRSTMRLERLVHDLSLAARLVDGISLQRAPVDLQDVLTQAIAEARVLHPTRSFRGDPPSTPVIAFADHDRLLQVLTNLLDNAARYSPHATPIAVRWVAERSTARVEVSDTGSGFTVEEQSLLFLRYARLRPSRRGAGATGGSGLGLFICKELVEAMGGHIGVRVDEDIPGNTFWFTLPLHDAISLPSL